MASTFSTNLALELIGTGDQAGTWGVTTNTNLGTLVEQAISGYVTQAVSTGADTTITIPNGATGVARNMYIELTGTGGTNTNLIVPSNKKLYFIFNNTSSGQVTVKVSGQTGVSVPNGKKVVLVCNGTDIVNGLNYIADFGTNSFTVTNLTATSATITNLIATTASISDASATVLRSASATITNLIATSASITTLTNNPTFSAGTANGVLYLNGSKVATSGSALVFDGTNLGIGTASPTEKLTVAGNIKLGTSGTTYVYGPATNGRSFIANSDSTAYIGIYGSAYGAGSNSIISFVAGTTNSMTFDASGNLGLGVTPATSTYKNFQINTTGVIGSTTGYVWFGNNWVYNGADRYIANGAATLYGSNEGKHTWFIAPSGTAGQTTTVTSGNSYTITGAGGTNYTSFGAANNNVATTFVATSSGTGNGGGVTQNIQFTQAMTLDTSGNLGLGTSSPGYRLHVVDNSTGTQVRVASSSSGGTSQSFINTATNGRSYRIGSNFVTGTGEFALYDDTAAAARLTVDSSGNLGLGVTPSAWNTSFKALQVSNSVLYNNGAADTFLGANFYNDTSGTNRYITSAQAAAYGQVNAAHQWYISTDPTPTAGNPVSFTQAMTLDASGNLAVGDTTNSAAARLYVKGSGATSGSVAMVVRNSTPADLLYIRNDGYTGFGLNATAMVLDASGNLGVGTTSPSVFGKTAIVAASGATSFYTGTGTQGLFISTDDSTRMVLYASSGSFGGGHRWNVGNTEAARIDLSGNFLVGTTNENPAVNNVAGHALKIGGLAEHSNTSAVVLRVNRKTDDGTLVEFLQDGTAEGNISVSGNTVSYNAFAGSHWSQLQDGSKPDILRGTVMESINELCEWPDENNERLPKSKVSDTAGSKKVYGVFMAWDNDWTETNDMYVTAVGAFICRVNGSVTVQEGDLLESNGDGTARVQADDIIRSSTIGKVTSTVKTHQYDDGSYCVPTVLYCG